MWQEDFEQFDVSIDASIDLSDHTFEAVVYSTAPSSSGSWSGGNGLLVGDIEATFTVNVVSLSDGQLNIGLTETQTEALSPNGSYRWYLRWSDEDGVTRTVLAGQFTTRIP